MQALEVLYNFNIELNEIYSIQSLESDEAFYYINKAQDRFVTKSYTGFNTLNKQGFEESQKRVDDLKNLVKPFQSTTNNPFITLPNDYRHLLRIFVYHTGNCVNSVIDIENDALIVGNNTYYPVFPVFCEQDDINYMLSDPFSKPTDREPLCVFQNGGIYVYLPNNVTITGYRIVYLSNPRLLTVNDPGLAQFTGKLYTNTTDLPDYCYVEILEDAISMYFKSINDPRYQGYSNETKTIE